MPRDAAFAVPHRRPSRVPGLPEESTPSTTPTTPSPSRRWISPAASGTRAGPAAGGRRSRPRRRPYASSAASTEGTSTWTATRACAPERWRSTSAGGQSRASSDGEVLRISTGRGTGPTRTTTSSHVPSTPPYSPHRYAMPVSSRYTEDVGAVEPQEEHRRVRAGRATQPRPPGSSGAGTRGRGAGCGGAHGRAEPETPVEEPDRLRRSGTRIDAVEPHGHRAPLSGSEKPPGPRAPAVSHIRP
jgi:hypothetical protein